ncbi:MAG TPA: hypothetical protein VD905_15955 [Flavobacteriales bacterium]|nr:hypothetical protein [Flavobacteriales bacterium]
MGLIITNNPLERDKFNDLSFSAISILEINESNGMMRVYSAAGFTIPKKIDCIASKKASRMQNNTGTTTINP